MGELSDLPKALSMFEFSRWQLSPQGRYILAWEAAEIEQQVSDIFGFNALQLGLPWYDALQHNRMSLKLYAGTACEGTLKTAVCCHPAALPFATQSIDLLVLPHLLEFSTEPHAILREAERVLIPEGHLLLTGFNPFSFFGCKKYCRRHPAFPWSGDFLSPNRLKDWLKLLGFEIERPNFGCYLSPHLLPSPHFWRLMEKTVKRCAPFSGSVYSLLAIKRVQGMRLITPQWQKVRPKGSLQPVVRSSSFSQEGES